jgi:hydroxymethylpyrimidine/phosphomethylpyrimidine kinase
MTSLSDRRCVLTIAGSDSGAGAGMQADARTIQALGGYAFTAITAVTAQNGLGVSAWRPVPLPLISAQITAVLDDYPVAAVKIGLLPTPATVRAVAKTLSPYLNLSPSGTNLSLTGRANLSLVVDPVIGSSSGTRFLSRDGVGELKRRLLPMTTLVTPNWPEAEALSGLRVRSDFEAESAARLLARECGCAVLVKGGHGRGKACRDCLAVPDGRVRWYASPRIKTRNTHGTGCVLSAAIAFELARGENVEKAVEKARRFLWKGLKDGVDARWGKGAGPAFGGLPDRH